MKVYLGADHNGFELKNTLAQFLKVSGYDVIDMGDKHFDKDDDFPVYASKVANQVLSSDDSEAKGVLMCGSGQGVCMAANRFKGIRASLCWNRQSARESRNDDDANVLCLPAKDLTEDEAKSITETWLMTKYANAARFNRRIKEMDSL